MTRARPPKGRRRIYYWAGAGGSGSGAYGTSTSEYGLVGENTSTGTISGGQLRLIPKSDTGYPSHTPDTGTFYMNTTGLFIYYGGEWKQVTANGEV